MKTQILFGTVLMISFCLLTTACVNEDEGNRLKTGDTIPSFTVGGPEGNFSSASFSKGGILVFFASYCSTCQSVLPEVQKLWEASDDGTLFTVAALSRQQIYDETEESVAIYWTANGYTMPYYLDIKGEVYYRFAKETIPRIYIIDNQMKITFMSVGNGAITAGDMAVEIEKASGIEIDLP